MKTNVLVPFQVSAADPPRDGWRHVGDRSWTAFDCTAELFVGLGDANVVLLDGLVGTFFRSSRLGAAFVHFIAGSSLWLPRQLWQRRHVVRDRCTSVAPIGSFAIHL